MIQQKKKSKEYQDFREAVNVSISAIHQILKDQYNAEAKLYAARVYHILSQFLKDCFEKGNPAFISKT